MSTALGSKIEEKEIEGSNMGRRQNSNNKEGRNRWRNDPKNETRSIKKELTSEKKRNVCLFFHEGEEMSSG